MAELFTQQKLNVLVIGSGGREHAIIKKLAQSPRAGQLYALPGNAGMQEAICLAGDPMDAPGVIAAAKAHAVDFCVVTPDDPLAAGLVDVLEGAGIPCFGPTQAAAQIEASKIFAKQLMQKYGIPTADWQAFDQAEAALAHVAALNCPCVVKADGLARGKGVVVAQTVPQAQDAIRMMMQEHAFLQSGSRILVEEMLSGPEISVLTLVDGETVVPLVSAMDHKRALDDDAGENTGGMGAIAPNPWYTPQLARQAMEEIFLPTARAMVQEGIPFRGCLFFGLMLTPQGPKVLEYNARFGDPETQAVLALLQSDLLAALLCVRAGKLDQADVRFSREHACCVVLASAGYPSGFAVDKPILIGKPKATLHFAGVRQQRGQLVTAGGRVLGVTAVGVTLVQAIHRAYVAADQVQFEGAYRRNDIGQSALRARRQLHR